MKRHVKVVIPKILDGARADRALASLAPGVSRSHIQQLMKKGFVRRGDDLVKARDRVKGGEEITLQLQSIQGNSPRDPSYRVLCETSEYLVLEKPSGVLVHPTVHTHENTLIDSLVKNFPEIRKVGDDPQRPGIVHRLDREASGVMVVARTQDSFESLKQQFKLRRVRKEYLILVFGMIEPQEGEIRSYIGRSKGVRSRFASHAHHEGRLAVTRYTVEKLLKGATLVRVSPETGRTHQIRVHMLSRGCPIVGDRTYASKKIKKKNDERLMLHSLRLGFFDLAGCWQEFVSEPDQDFLSVVHSFET